MGKAIFVATVVMLIGISTGIGCAWFDKTTPEFQAAYDAHGKTYHLAAQVREAERVSQAAKVRAGERFLANCDTYSRTIADLLVTDYGADPAEVWLVQVSGKKRGMWITRTNHLVEIPVGNHQIVIYGGWVIDNRWRPVLKVKDLEWEYVFEKMQNMQDKLWVAYDPGMWKK